MLWFCFVRCVVFCHRATKTECAETESIGINGKWMYTKWRMTLQFLLGPVIALVSFPGEIDITKVTTALKSGGMGCVDISAPVQQRETHQTFKKTHWKRQKNRKLTICSTYTTHIYRYIILLDHPRNVKQLSKLCQTITVWPINHLTFLNCWSGVWITSSKIHQTAINNSAITSNQQFVTNYCPPKQHHGFFNLHQHYSSELYYNCSIGGKFRSNVVCFDNYFDDDVNDWV